MVNIVESVKVGYNHHKTAFGIRIHIKTNLIQTDLKNLNDLITRLNELGEKSRNANNLGYVLGGLGYVYTHLPTIIRFEDIDIEIFLEKYSLYK